jgi:hypothetical protein
MAAAKSCSNCAGFPWDPGADLSLTPPVACHPALMARHWDKQSLALENNCPYFQAKPPATPPPSVAPPPPDTDQGDNQDQGDGDKKGDGETQGGNQELLEKIKAAGDQLLDPSKLAKAPKAQLLAWCAMLELPHQPDEKNDDLRAKITAKLAATLPGGDDNDPDGGFTD